MSVNFYEARCQENRNEDEFGLCDNNDETPAYSSIDQVNNRWIARVFNGSNIDVTFTAIDHCIEIYKPDGNMDSSCDGMLTYTDNIVFVELKDKTKDWKSGGISQLENTINHYIDNENISTIKHKRAFVANRRHPNFQVIDTDTKQRFFSKYRIRVMVEASIKI